MGTYHYYIRSKTHPVEIGGERVEAAVEVYSHKVGSLFNDMPRTVTMRLARNENVWGSRHLPRYMLNQHTIETGAGPLFDFHTSMLDGQVSPQDKLASHYDERTHLLAGLVRRQGRTLVATRYTTFMVRTEGRVSDIYGQIEALRDMLGENSGFVSQSRSFTVSGGAQVLGFTIFLHCATPAQQSVVKLHFETARLLDEIQAEQHAKDESVRQAARQARLDGDYRRAWAIEVAAER